MNPGTLDALCRKRVTFPQLYLSSGFTATPDMAAGTCDQSLTVFKLGGTLSNPKGTTLGFSIVLPYDPQSILAANKSGYFPELVVSFGSFRVSVDFYGNVTLTFNDQQVSFGSIRLKQETDGQIRFAINFDTNISIYGELECALGQVPKGGITSGDFGTQQQAYLAFLDASSPVSGSSAALLNGTLSTDLGLENAYVGFMVLANMQEVECNFQTVVPGTSDYVFGLNLVQKILLLIIVVLCFALLLALFVGLRVRNESS